MTTRAEHYTAEAFITAIKNSAGIVSTIAARVGCAWNTARKYIDTHPTVLEAYNAECEAVLDMAENTLYKLVKDGDFGATKYLLSTKGKRRGYVERIEQTGADGGAMEIRIIDATEGNNG